MSGIIIPWLQSWNNRSHFTNTSSEKITTVFRARTRATLDASKLSQSSRCGLNKSVKTKKNKNCYHESHYFKYFFSKASCQGFVRDSLKVCIHFQLIILQKQNCMKWMNKKENKCDFSLSSGCISIDINLDCHVTLGDVFIVDVTDQEVGTECSQLCSIVFVQIWTQILLFARINVRWTFLTALFDVVLIE